MILFGYTQCIKYIENYLNDLYPNLQHGFRLKVIYGSLQYITEYFILVFDVSIQ
jgi:hypothetical protein